MPRGQRKTTRAGEKRKARIPLGTPQPKLAVQANPGMVGRWVNDVGGRIHQAEMADWKKVFSDPETPDGEPRPITHTVGVKEDGSPMVAYYMEIPKKLYEADQREKQKEVDRVDDAIRHGNIEGEVGTDGRYVPSQGINVRSQ